MNKILGTFAVVCLAVAANAQNWTTVSASNITDLNQQKLAAGTLCFLITDLNDNPISVNIGGGGQSLQRPFCSSVTNGSAASFTVPNPANTAPANISYRVTATDSSTGQIVLRYTEVQFTGGTFNFDNYVPGFNLPLGSSAPVLSVGVCTVPSFTQKIFAIVAETISPRSLSITASSKSRACASSHDNT